MTLRFGSVCSGIEAASAAWLPLGLTCSFMAEIDAFPRAVLEHHYPETPLHGDFQTIRAGEYGPIDVLVGGTPCQSFSVAGLRGGMADARGNLALEYLRLADRLRPRWLVWENVPGVRSSNQGRDFGAFLGGLGELGYGWAYRSLDAQYFGLAQRRERVFVVGCLGDWRGAAAVLFEPASLRGDSAPRRETGERPAPTIAARTRGGGGLGTDFDCDGGLIAATIRPPSHGAAWRGDGCDNLVASALRSRDGARGVDSDCTDTLVAYGGNNTAGPIEVATAVNAHGGPHGRLDFESETFVATHRLSGHGYWNDSEVSATITGHGGGGKGASDDQTLITHALRADGFDASEDGTGRGTPLVATGFQSSQSGVRSVETHATLDANNGSRRHNGAVIGAAVRRLTPRECERLMGFPDGYTAIRYRGKPATDGSRYKALGNSMAVPVMSWLGRRITERAAA
jgi:DNA (cytosine-5)-methyltransferase 1